MLIHLHCPRFYFHNQCCAFSLLSNSAWAPSKATHYWRPTQKGWNSKSKTCCWSILGQHNLCADNRRDVHLTRLPALQQQYTSCLKWNILYCHSVFNLHSYVLSLFSCCLSLLPLTSFLHHIRLSHQLPLIAHSPSSSSPHPTSSAKVI